MLRSRQSPTLQVIDRAFLTRRRIVRHFQSALLITFVAAAVLVQRLPTLIVVSLVFAVAAVFVPRGIQRLIDIVFPQAVRARLPYGPVDVSAIFGSPHNYADLLRIWRDPAWQCNHRTDLRVPVSASSAVMALPALLLFVAAAAAISAEVIIATNWNLEAASAVAAFAITTQVAVTAVWNRRLRSRAIDLPTTGDVWITFSIAAMSVLVGLTIAWRIAGA